MTATNEPPNAQLAKSLSRRTNTSKCAVKHPSTDAYCRCPRWRDEILSTIAVTSERPCCRVRCHVLRLNYDSTITADRLHTKRGDITKIEIVSHDEVHLYHEHRRATS